jgi:hypothetical protein
VSRLCVTMARAARHDSDFGATSVWFESRSPGGPRKDFKLEGTWQVIAYAETAGAFLLGGKFGRGAWLPLVALTYVDERTGDQRRSRFSHTDWMAMAAVPSPRGRFVALVGRIDDDQQFELQVLDTSVDLAVTAGRAPAPPPDDFYCSEHVRLYWGDTVDGLVTMDAGIIAFPAEGTLAVSYGADTCRKRAKRRRTKLVDLAQLFARGPALVPRIQGE